MGKSSMVIGLAALLAGPVRAEPPPPPRPPELGPARSEALCGDPGLRGAPLAAIPGEGGCGVAAPVRLDSAAGVTLEPPATVACPTARALLAWLEGTAIGGFAAAGGELRTLNVADAYSCRNRNRAASGKLSEHAVGQAIDIGGFGLADGRAVTVLAGWDSPDWGAALRRLREGACGPFGTVLGPGSNALHADHFHFDVAARRSGPWCE